jgi:Uma2 family endonuclease
LCLVKGAPRDYCDRHPRGEDAALVVEVADSSLERDRMKCRIYARAGIAAYWIVNLIDRQIEVYAEISGEDGQAEYRKRQVLTTSDVLPMVIPGCAPIEVAVASLLT